MAPVGVARVGVLLHGLDDEKQDGPEREKEPPESARRRARSEARTTATGGGGGDLPRVHAVLLVRLYEQVEPLRNHQTGQG